MNQLVEDFLQYLRHERGQAEHTQKNLRRAVEQDSSPGPESRASPTGNRSNSAT